MRQLIDFVFDSAHSLKAAVGIICYNIGTGMMGWMEMIPDSIANLNTLFAAILAVILAGTHIRKMFANRRAEEDQSHLVKLQEEKLTLEIEGLKALKRRRGDRTRNEDFDKKDNER